MRPQEMLYLHFAGHWYVEEPHRGCAFRSLTYAPPLVDSLLMRAADGAGVRDAAFGSAQARGETDFLLWVRAPGARSPPSLPLPPLPERCALLLCGRRGLSEAAPPTARQINPGEVKVLRGKGLPQIIYQTEGVQANPYGGLRLNIAPTVVNVRLDAPIDLDAPREQHVASPEQRPQNHMLASAPSGAHVEGSATPPSPFHHSPQMMGATGSGPLDFRFSSHPPSMSLPQNIGGAPAGSGMPSMAGFPGMGGMGAMMQQPTQRPQARPAPAFACS